MPPQPAYFQPERHSWLKSLTVLRIHVTQQEATTLAKPNYSFEKRQRELAKKQKKAEKLQRKAMPGDAPDEVDEPEVDTNAPAAEGSAEA